MDRQKDDKIDMDNVIDEATATFLQSYDIENSKRSTFSESTYNIEGLFISYNV